MASLPTSSAAAGTGQALYRRARERIPGGVQLLSKRPEQYQPGGWPAYYRRAEGCTVWDLDDRPYLDFTTNGIGTCLLGYADPTVNAAVADCIARGSMCTLNCPADEAFAALAEQIARRGVGWGIVAISRVYPAPRLGRSAAPVYRDGNGDRLERDSSAGDDRDLFAGFFVDYARPTAELFGAGVLCVVPLFRSVPMDGVQRLHNARVLSVCCKRQLPKENPYA